MKSAYRNGESKIIKGLSTDQKDTVGIANGTHFYEMDTGIEYEFDEENGQWIRQAGNKEIQEEVDLLTIIARNQIDFFDNYDAILEIINRGMAQKVFKIGDQILTKWNNGTNDLDLPWDVVDFRNVVNEKGHTVPAMIVQAHWALPGLQFDASEAAYVAASAIEPGTYYIEIGTNWGTHCVAGKKYEFTTAEEIPAGGQIVFSRSGTDIYAWGAPDQSTANWVCYTFASNSATTPLETLSLTEYAADETPTGTSLGSLASNVKYSESGINNLQRAAYGYNRWKHSAIRQWLNSNAAANSWWAPQNPFDRPPQQLSSMRGFMAGLPEGFIKVVNPIVVTTALNTVSDVDIAASETTIDRFFCASLEEEYCEPQLADVEGPYWPYWKERLGLNAPQGSGSANANVNHIRYSVSNHTSAQYVRLRSAYRGYAYYTWGVYSTGYVGSNIAAGATCPAPACAICSSD